MKILQVIIFSICLPLSVWAKDLSGSQKTWDQKLATKLELSQEQKQKLNSIKSKYSEDLKSAWQEAKKAKNELKLKTKQSLSKENLAPYVSKAKAAERKLEEKISYVESEAKEILKPSQRAKAKRMFADFKAKIKRRLEK